MNGLDIKIIINIQKHNCKSDRTNSLKRCVILLYKLSVSLTRTEKLYHFIQFYANIFAGTWFRYSLTSTLRATCPLPVLSNLEVWLSGCTLQPKRNKIKSRTLSSRLSMKLRCGAKPTISTIYSEQTSSTGYCIVQQPFQNMGVHL